MTSIRDSQAVALPLVQNVQNHDESNFDQFTQGHQSDYTNMRESWSSRWQLIFSTAGYCVGLGNIWRFPYLCAESGGGAFLIPYFIMTFTLGTSLFYLEQSIGQMTQSAPIKAFYKLKPQLMGVGLGNIMITFLKHRENFLLS